MCGLAGIVHFDGKAVDASALRLMTDIARHRGPDDQGFRLFSLREGVSAEFHPHGRAPEGSFSGGVGFNVDPNGANYGEVTGSYIEVRWQRRSYDVGVFYSPYDGLGGVRVRLNDFNFKGPGVPFVPYTPSQQLLQRPF